LDKKLAGLLGAAAALGTMSSAEAVAMPGPTAVLQASSYADLLQPIPDASLLLQAIDTDRMAPTGEAKIQLARHHHHHHHYRRRHHHHHHHG
jgi:hypothetical protein